jgi:glycosyltransferase involved in cell wall biosynthesis
MIRSGYPIVFSSFDVLNDFKKFYSYAQNKVFVIPFLSIIGDNYKKINSIDILKKYKLPETYFVCSNQFWTHKNHIIILKALKILKEKNIDVNIVFTGKEYDYRNPRYFSSLQKYIRKNELEKYVLFLGFIDRDEQVKIIDNSLCIIQPSLFEGWSTIVEDAKALNKYIIVSDIPIHREQIAQNCLFFNPADPSELSEKIIFCIQKNNEETHKDYRINVKQFAMNILNLV